MDGGQAWMGIAGLGGLALGLWLGRRGRAATATSHDRGPTPALTAAPSAALGSSPLDGQPSRVVAPNPAAVAATEPAQVSAPSALAVSQIELNAEADLTAAQPPLFDQPVDLLAQMEVLRRTEEAAEAERDDLLAERDTLSRQLAEQRQRLSAQAKELGELKTELQREAGAVAGMQLRLAELEPLPAALAQAKAQSAQLQGRLDAALEAQHEAHRELQAARQRLTQEQGRAARLEDELQRAVSAEQLRLAEAEAEAEKARCGAATEQLQALQQAHSGLQKQFLTLHGATHRARKLALQLREAQAAVVAARSLVGADDPAAASAVAPPSEALRASEIAGLVTTWAAQPGVHAVAVADGRGLLVAGQGAQAAALAARAASLYRALQQQSAWSAGLTLGGADVLQLRDRNGLSLMIKPWQAPGGALLLAVLARDGVEAQPWAAELLHRPHSVFVWSNPMTRDKKVATVPSPSEQPVPV